MDPTTYTNQPVALAALPDIRELETVPISPRYRILNLLTWAAIMLGLCVLLSALRFQPWFPPPEPFILAYPVAIGIIISVGLMNLVYHWLADPLIRYAVREQDLVLQRGLFFRVLVCQPILRVQHIELKRGPLERLAGLARLQVFSAGGSAHTFEVPGLTPRRAAQLRQFILDHKELDAR